MALEIFNWSNMPPDTHYGNDPDSVVRLSRGMSKSDLCEGKFPIQSRAFKFGPRGSIKAVAEAVNSGDGSRLAEFVSKQTTDGFARHADINTPFISARPGSVEFHASRYPDGVIVEFEVPAHSIIVPWLMENTPGKEPHEVLLVGAVPGESIKSIKELRK